MESNTNHYYISRLKSIFIPIIIYTFLECKIQRIFIFFWLLILGKSIFSIYSRVRGIFDNLRMGRRIEEGWELCTGLRRLHRFHF